MSGDHSSKPPGERRSWLDRIGQLFSGEPRNREDLIEVLRAAREDGLLEAATLSMLEGAMAVSERQVADVMVPRPQMVAIDAEATLAEILTTVIESGHSRFPVLGEDRDQIIGILLAKDLLPAIARGESGVAIEPLLRKPVFIPESKRLNMLLREFRLSRNHMAVVIDEYGGVAGLVTIEDVLEQIVGEIDDEHDKAEDTSAQIAAQADGEYLVDALTPIEDFNEHFGSDFPDDEYDTVGGYRIATGAQAGRKVVTLQTLPGDADPLEGDAGKVGGFSLHAGVAAGAHESHKLAKLCRYITRPAISEKRLSISPQGRVRYQLKTPWRTERAQRVKAQRAQRALPRSGRMAPRMSNGMRWTLSPSWPRWSRHHARISPGSTAYLPRTPPCERS